MTNTVEKKELLEEERFAQNVGMLVVTMEEIIKPLYEKGLTKVSPTVVKATELALKVFKKSVLVEKFIEYSYDYWENIRKRDREYFIEHAVDIFKDFPTWNISTFRSLFEGGDKALISKEDEECIADYFETFVKISIKYIHRKRNPVKSNNSKGEVSITYKDKFLENVDLQASAKNWKIDLIKDNSSSSVSSK